MIWSRFTASIPLLSAGVQQTVICTGRRIGVGHQYAAKGATVGKRLDDWVDRIGLKLLHVEDLEGESEFKPDFTGASLENLERALLRHFGEPGDIADPQRRGLADGAAGYLGEVLLRLAGGSWDWQDGEPLIRADTAIGLAPVYPLRILARAVGGKSEHEFCTVYAAWEKTAARHRAANPNWIPAKTRTPGVDPVEVSPADVAYITTWANQRQAAFARWSQTYGPHVAWDFGPASLDALENLLQYITPTPQDLRDPKHSEFVQGAVWYLGEALRRTTPGHWTFRTFDPTAPSVYAGDPYLQHANPDGKPVIPILVLHDFLRDRLPGTLREQHARWTHHPQVR